ncbi:hypothetical protein AB0395_29720 [Streptosporangium sp. NPDC051023]
MLTHLLRAVYVMYCGACGSRLLVPAGAATVRCPGCGQDRNVSY